MQDRRHWSNQYGVDEVQASLLELFKDLPIAIVSFLVASFFTKDRLQEGYTHRFSYRFYGMSDDVFEQFILCG